MAMTLLAIDTAAPRLQLALLRQDGGVSSLVEDMAQGQAERIFPAIAELLAEAGIAYADLQRIAVTTGPGSFTGVRIGLSAARGLSLALGVPTVGISTFDAWAQLAPPETFVSVLLDARRGQMYRRDFFGSAPIEDGPLTISTVPEVFTGIGPPRPKLVRFLAKQTHVLGTGASAAAAATGATDLEASRPDSERGFIDVASLARMAVDLDPRRWRPEPVYGRGADAKPQDRFRIERAPAS
jgi:tRNA threonylcarbamoyladenosine biosynthesis protein TsaB